jgi:hypothetical protein
MSEVAAAAPGAEAVAWRAPLCCANYLLSWQPANTT